MKDHLSFFGAIAVSMCLVTEDELNAAVKLQEDLIDKGQRKRLGDILCEQGHISPTDIEIILAMQQAYDTATEETHFGELAIANGLVTEDDINDALRVQKTNNRKETIGGILVERGCLTEHQLNALLYTQARLREKFAAS